MIPAKAEIVMGTGSFGVSGTRQDAYRLLDAYVDLGGGIIDTAAVYSDWVPGEARRSETIIGEWLRTRRGPRPMIVTKGGHPPIADVHAPRLDPDSIRSDAEISLKALGIDRIDLYFLHRDDPAQPVADIMGTMSGLMHEGKIAAIGLSNWSPVRIAEARTMGLAPIASNQLLGNILSNHIGPLEDDTLHKLDVAAFHDAEVADMSLMLFTSQADGVLSKRARGDEIARAAYRSPAALLAADELVAIARETGIEPTRLGLAFLLQFSRRFLPIVGPKNLDRLNSSMQAREVRLAPEIMERIARISGFDRYPATAAG